MIIVIVGASGSGKDTIGDNLSQFFDIPELVSFTTRPKRKREIDGINYHFVSKGDVEHLDIVESTTYSGNSYGLLKKEVENKLDNYDHVYFIADEDGAIQISEMYPGETITLWLCVSEKEMKKRMSSRGDKRKDIRSRIRHARKNKEFEEPRVDNLIAIDANQNEYNVLDSVIRELDRRIDLPIKKRK